MAVRYRLGCELSYQVLSPTVFIFNLEVAELTRHRDLSEKVTIEPQLKRQVYAAPHKNRYIGISAEPGSLRLAYEAQVTLDAHRADPSAINEMQLHELPLEILPYLLPSRFVPSDRLENFAIRQFGHLERGHHRVTSICNWIHDNLEYRRGSSNGQTTADESLILRAGVCRDFAHLGISFCRALAIPARFVSCYAYGLQPGDFHAVFEAYLDGRWWLFDATRQAHLDGLVRIGIGRDAAEIAFATQFGQIDAGPMRVFIERADGAPEPAIRTTEAISISEPGAQATTT